MAPRDFDKISFKDRPWSPLNFVFNTGHSPNTLHVLNINIYIRMTETVFSNFKLKRRNHSPCSGQILHQICILSRTVCKRSCFERLKN